MATLSSMVQQLILPFSTQRTPSFGLDIEAAAVFSLVERERNAGVILLKQQLDVKLLSLSKIGYPIWLLSKNELSYVFDGMKDSPDNVTYSEAPSAKTFMDNLQSSSTTYEGYTDFLLNRSSYFEQPPRNVQFTIKGLIVDGDFKKELNAYRKEAIGGVNALSLGLLSPILDVSTVACMVDELSKIQGSLLKDAETLVECRRQVENATSQYISELEFARQAEAEESNAKIRAQEELIKPEIAKLKSTYRRQIKTLEQGYDMEIIRIKKIRAKTQKYLKYDEAKVKLYEHQANLQASKHHRIYEERWKDKRRTVEKELSQLKQQLNNFEKSIASLTKQRSAETTRLDLELNSRTKLACEPLLQLQAGRDAKALAFKAEADRLVGLEKPVIQSIDANIKVRQRICENFESLGIRSQQNESPLLLYIPFYLACYELGTAKRYLTIPPSIVAGACFSSKLKGVLSISKVGDLLSPLFQSITHFIQRNSWFDKQNLAVDKQVGDLSEKFDLLKNSLFIEYAQKGLVYLQRDGWLLEKEYEALANRLSSYKSF